MEKYGFNELMQYIIEDFKEFTTELNYTAEQSTYRILDEYVRAIRNWEFQKATIYFTLALLTHQFGKIPQFIYDEVINLILSKNIERYIGDITTSERDDFLSLVSKVKKII